jgi:hypothetical protein
MSSDTDRASALLSWAGERLMEIDGVMIVGIWSDLDCSEIRDALRVFGSGEAPVKYLDGPGVSDKYKLRRAVGEPVPMDVLVEMERHPKAPWEIRDAMLGKIGWYEASSWENWVRWRNARIFRRDGNESKK